MLIFYDSFEFQYDDNEKTRQDKLLPLRDAMLEVVGGNREILKSMLEIGMFEIKTYVTHKNIGAYVFRIVAHYVNDGRPPVQHVVPLQKPYNA